MVPSKAVGNICLALLITGHINLGMFTAGLLGMEVRNIKTCDPFTVIISPKLTFLGTVKAMLPLET